MDRPMKETVTIIVLMALVVSLSVGLGFYFADVTVAGRAQSVSATAQTGGNVVNLLVVPDYGGAGYDAFVKDTNINSTAPQPATNNTGPGPNDNNITISAGAQVKFVITSVDSAVLQNFTGSVTTPFEIYNDTNTGQVAVHYTSGQSISNLAIGHTFTVSQVGLNIPLPPLTMVTFTYAFSKPGVYLYQCETPCGPGMNMTGYMNGYIIVTQ